MLLLISLTEPTQAAVYKCQQGTQTVYSDVPCPSAKIVDTTNGKTPTAADRYSAQARSLREQIKLDDAEYQAERDKKRREACMRRVRDNNWIQNTAAKYANDTWWKNKAADSAELLSNECSKYMMPTGAK
ncbi:MAG: DUF4124 domain-containing protein [Nevskia sp.]|nr:DUF4124 domain-containing protein [Nevskia sp.]